MIKIKLQDIVDYIKGVCLNNTSLDKTYNNIVIDSRCANKEDIFIALKGKTRDGHDYIYDVIEKGVCAIIVNQKLSIKTNIPIIYTPNNYDTILKIGKFYREHFLGKIVAITGSCGKTMTKELISSILETKYKVKKSIGNQNNHLGMPLTLMTLDNSYEVAVLELGMNHKGEIEKLVNVCKPSVGVITNIGTAHIGNLGSQRKIFKAKMEIIKGMKNGTLVINGNDKYLSKVKSKSIKVIKCYQEEKINSNLVKSIFFVMINNKKYKFVLHMPGKHLIQNCLLAINVGLLFDVNIKDMQKVINNYKPLNNRLNIIRKNSNTIIDDSYNSNYEAVIGLISMLENIKKSKIIILGDILELGKYSKKIHKKIGKILSKSSFEKIILVGKNMYYAYKKCEKAFYFKTVDEVIKYLEKTSINNKIIALKASHSMHFEKILKNLL